jgi:hypothetical protein
MPTSFGWREGLERATAEMRKEDLDRYLDRYLDRLRINFQA